MEEILFKALNQLFKGFEQYGDYPDEEMFKVLALVAIDHFVEADYDGYLTDKDMRQIERAIECIIGEGCLLPLKVNCCK